MSDDKICKLRHSPKRLKPILLVRHNNSVWKLTYGKENRYRKTSLAGSSINITFRCSRKLQLAGFLEDNQAESWYLRMADGLRRELPQLGKAGDTRPNGANKPLCPV
ncbi:unnamed protein product [Nezara viridula]|uniref:Uncharacterized protein n=1 Tax=Nezara viridula TaxID=85310 RepID=A0A9P0MR00_NEZVI|nr:unnamed protein product [Nezara viridula]